MEADQGPTPEMIRRAKVFWEQSGQDFKAAKAALRRREHLQSSLLSLQAALNGLSAVCHLHGHFQLPAASPVRLLTLCAAADPRFGELIEDCAALEQATEIDPFSEKRDPEQEADLGRRCAGEGGRLRKFLNKYLKENQSRYFKP